MRTLLPVLGLIAMPAFAQTALNDTGQTQCFDGGVLAACTETNTGDSATHPRPTHPRQDGRFGRDARAGEGLLAKVGAGAAGFDFTKICNSGEAAATGTCPENPRPGSDPNEWGCTRDNVTGLLWEVKTPANANATFTFADASAVHVGAINDALLCGHNDWRVPARRELLSIVHHGAASSPRIDTAFFPNTQGSSYWSSDVYAPDPAYPWGVYFVIGSTYAYHQSNVLHVRLVRSGQ